MTDSDRSAYATLAGRAVRALVETLELRCPILQAPIGGAAGPELAAAVSEAGALGALALTWASPEAASAQVRAVRELTAAPFQVNFALSFPPVALPAVLDAGAPIVTFSWGDPEPYVQRVREYEALLGIQVSSAEGARMAMDLGADVIICQGLEAGGHVQATRPLYDVLASVVDVAGSVPVVAAGGISTANGMARAIQAGAGGVAFGTRFLATVESRAHPLYKQAIVDAASADAVLTGCFEGGWPYAPHRVLHNSTLRDWEARGCPPVGSRPGEHDIVATTENGLGIARYGDTAPLGNMTGNVLAMALYAGTGCGEISDVPTVAELVRRLCAAHQAAGTDRLSTMTAAIPA